MTIPVAVATTRAGVPPATAGRPLSLVPDSASISLPGFHWFARACPFEMPSRVIVFSSRARFAFASLLSAVVPRLNQAYATLRFLSVPWPLSLIEPSSFLASDDRPLQPLATSRKYLRARTKSVWTPIPSAYALPIAYCASGRPDSPALLQRAKACTGSAAPARPSARICAILIAASADPPCVALPYQSRARALVCKKVNDSLRQIRSPAAYDFEFFTSKYDPIAYSILGLA